MCCNVLEWNKEIDAKYLDQRNTMCKQNNQQQEIRNVTKQKYLRLIDEWSN